MREQTFFGPAGSSAAGTGAGSAHAETGATGFSARTGATAVAALCLAACATTGPNPESDPYEGFNRKMYAFNDGLDRAVLEPAAKGYRAVTNRPVRKGVQNFVENLGEPVTFANEVLQGKFPAAASTVGRFVVNTTVGIAGVFNPAEAMGMDRTDEDFGQTLAVWGVAQGPYLVLPFLGSSSPRDLFGKGADLAMNPINHATFDNDDETRMGLAALGGISARERAIEVVDDLRTTQFDPYATVRRFYIRDRAAEAGITVSEPED
ncbi:MAG: VacJ family lipoprotein, partial [Hyphomonadaceae bacterium]